MVELAAEYGRCGYRRITATLNSEGWQLNHKRLERLWRLEGLKLPAKQPKRGRLWLTDGSCVRLRPAFKGHVWSYDFMVARTRDGRAPGHHRRVQQGVPGHMRGEGNHQR
jgi:transposase InsO family protein